MAKYWPIFGEQKQAGAELKKKKKFFGKKWGKTIELKGQKFTNLKKKECVLQKKTRWDWA